MVIRTVRYAAVMALVGLVVSGCGTTVSVRTSARTTTSAPTSAATRSTDDATLRLALPADWRQLGQRNVIRAQEDLAHRTVWMVGGAGDQPADLVAIHEVDTAPRPGTDVSIQHERALIEEGVQTYIAHPEIIGEFAQSSGHSCFADFEPKEPVTHWEQHQFIGLQLEWTCIAQVPVKGWAVIAFDPAGVKHRFVISAPPSYWSAHQAQIDDVRRSLTALATAP